MGLPIWREPSTEPHEELSKDVEHKRPHDRVTTGGIRRRAWSRNVDAAQQRIQRRRRSLFPPQLDFFGETTNTQEIRRQGDTGVPPITTLLETADRIPRTASPPPAVLASRSYFESEENNDPQPSWTRTPSLAEERLRLVAQVRRAVSHLNRATPPILSRTGHEVNTTHMDGLGDRNRSPTPTPTDAWETMRMSIAPDTNLPSADSSFTTAIASQSFNSSHTSTNTSASSTDSLQRSNSTSDDDEESSASSVEMHDVCAEDEGVVNEATANLARDMYYQEMETPEGRARIAEYEAQNERYDYENRYAVGLEPASVQIGFMLLEAAVSRVSGQSRQESMPELNRLSYILDHYQHRQLLRHLPQTEVSTDAPQAHPVSMPALRSPAEVTEDSILSAVDVNDHMEPWRRIVEALSERDDIPEEWWMSMGLNFSRTRPRRVRDTRVRESQTEHGLNRVRMGRIERLREDARNSRL